MSVALQMSSCLTGILSITDFMAVTDIKQVTDLVAVTEIIEVTDIVAVTDLMAVTHIMAVTDIIAAIDISAVFARRQLPRGQQLKCLNYTIMSVTAGRFMQALARTLTHEHAYSLIITHKKAHAIRISMHKHA